MNNTSRNRARIPVATYRLQFNQDFRFSNARDLVPYLNDLGISDIYASPYFKARKGSSHGYDILDHNTINPEVGSPDDYREMIAVLHKHDMGHILDIVPNHMCVEDSGNEWWMDVLENGPSSVYSGFFDINWNPVKQVMRNKVLLPILGDQYGAVLENCELRLAFADGAFALHYYDHCFPIMPKTYGQILSHRLEKLESAMGSDHPHYHELLSIMTALEHLPHYTEQGPAGVAEGYREKEIIKRRLAKLCKDSNAIRDFIASNVRIFNGAKGAPASFDLLDRLLREQVYRLSYWQVATEEINYRRFFDINALGAIRVEKSDVFAAVHRMVFDLVRKGQVTGLRVDHADGLYNPSEYLRRLQAGCFAHKRMGGQTLAPEDIQGPVERHEKQFEKLYAKDSSFRPFYIISEKILSRGEQLPGSWPVYGDTGYSFADILNGIYVVTENARAFDKIYRRFTKTATSFPELVYEKKKLVMQAAMSSEINTLAHYLDRIADIDRHTLDFTLQSLVKALVEVIAFFPVYRTYTSGFEVSDRDRQYIEYAIGRAKRKNPAMSATIFDFIRDVLMLDFRSSAIGDTRCIWLDFVMRFQQITGPVMAKGKEDTAFYLFNRLISLNEVGGAPERFGLPLASFHELNQERGISSPHTLLATSTHDTKRSEDVRARINVLSEMPLAWREGLGRWSRLNRKHKRFVEGQLAPDRNEEYLLYQTLIGAWPFDGVEDAGFAKFRQRIEEYMTKALRETKVNSSWLNPNPAWEEATSSFINAILKKNKTNLFLREMEQFQAMTSACGIFNSLSQTLLKITSPGVPDFYQGNEMWDLSLVDPDNRRPVDYQTRRNALTEIMRLEQESGAEHVAGELLKTRRDGRIKLYLIRTALEFRKRKRKLLEQGTYVPLWPEGEKSENVCAFARTGDDDAAIIVAPRFFTRLIREPEAIPCGRDVWGETRLILPSDLPGSRYRNIFTGEMVTGSPHDGRTVLPLGEILASFPVAILERLSQ